MDDLAGERDAAGALSFGRPRAGARWSYSHGLELALVCDRVQQPIVFEQPQGAVVASHSRRHDSTISSNTGCRPEASDGTQGHRRWPAAARATPRSVPRARSSLTRRARAAPSSGRAPLSAPSRARPARGGRSRRPLGRCCGSGRRRPALVVVDAGDRRRERERNALERVVVVVEDDHVPRLAALWPVSGGAVSVSVMQPRIEVRVARRRRAVSQLPRNSPTVPYRSASTSCEWIVSRLTCRE